MMSQHKQELQRDPSFLFVFRDFVPYWLRDRAAYFKVVGGGGWGLTRSLKCVREGDRWNNSLTRNVCPL